MHKTQQIILQYLESVNLTQEDYERFCDKLGLRYLSLISLRKFRGDSGR